jgi:hypothetical protein
MRVCSYILDGLDMMKYGLPSDAKMLCVTSPDLKRFSVSLGPFFLSCPCSLMIVVQEAMKIKSYITVAMELWDWSEIRYWWSNVLPDTSLEDVSDRFTR